MRKCAEELQAQKEYLANNRESIGKMLLKPAKTTDASEEQTERYRFYIWYTIDKGILFTRDTKNGTFYELTKDNRWVVSANAFAAYYDAGGDVREISIEEVRKRILRNYLLRNDDGVIK